MLRRSALDDVGPFKVAVGRLGQFSLQLLFLCKVKKVLSLGTFFS